MLVKYLLLLFVFTLNLQLLFPQDKITVELKVGHLYKLSAYIKQRMLLLILLTAILHQLLHAYQWNHFPLPTILLLLGATKDWTKVEVQFIASKKTTG
jgi:hypothetical protein